MKIGAKIYYELESGKVILNTGERSGDVLETTSQQDFEIFPELSSKNPDSLGYIQLEYGAFTMNQEKLHQIKGIDLVTLEPLFE